MQPKLLYLHSGGVAPVLNCTFASIISACTQNSVGLYSSHGIHNAINGNLFEIKEENTSFIKNTPASFLSTSRLRPSDEEIEKLLAVLYNNKITAVIIQGGNDSQETLMRLYEINKKRQNIISFIGIAKTIDNDLQDVYACPGYPSAAKYLAISFMESAWDMIAMHQSSTKILVLETMGRNTGWLAAATSIVSQRYELPHILCLPEHIHDEDYLVSRVNDLITQKGYCLITVAEGYPFAEISNLTYDQFGHASLGGQGSSVASFLNRTLHTKVRYVRPDVCQRSCGHILSKYDYDMANRLGQAAVEAALAQKSNIMIASPEYDFNNIKYIELKHIANKIRHMPQHFISSDGSQTTHDFTKYLEEIIEGEVYPKYNKGLPIYTLPHNFI